MAEAFLLMFVLLYTVFFFMAGFIIGYLWTRRD